MNINIDPISNLPSHSYNYINKIGANPIVFSNFSCYYYSILYSI